MLYTPTDRQPDFIVQAGPSLDLVLPLGGRSRFYANGALDYLWFARTASQRRWNGSAFAGLADRGGTHEASIEERYAQTFSRPNYEVNDRVLQTVEGTSGDLTRRLFGRLRLTLRGSRDYTQTDQGQDYLGTDLGTRPDPERLPSGGELSYGVTIKTSLVVLGGYQWNRYPLAAASRRRLPAGGRRPQDRCDGTDLRPGPGGPPVVLPRRRRHQDRQITWVDVSSP